MSARLVSRFPLAALLVLAALSPSYLAAAGDDGGSAARRAAASVVQIVVSGYRPVGLGPDAADTVRRTDTRASGVVVDDGVIATSSHLLAGADHIDVVVPAHDRVAARMVTATLLGIAPEVDLALLLVPVLDLPALPLRQPATLQAGQALFALAARREGAPSPQPTSIHAVAPPSGPGTATALLSLDPPPGLEACGGPVVDDAGALVGLTTCLPGATTAGLAVPGAAIALAVPQLEEFGHLHRARLGLTVEAVSPPMRAALGLGDTPGVIVADLAAEGPAMRAGLRVGDLLTAIGGRPLDDLAITTFTQQMLALADGQRVTIALERDGHRGTATVIAEVPDHDCVRDTLRPLDDHVVARLGIIGVPVDAAIAPALPGLRAPSGVVVLWRLDESGWPDLGLSRGDVIHGVNGARVTSTAELRSAVARLGAADPVVLQVERDGALTFLSADARR